MQPVLRDEAVSELEAILFTPHAVRSLGRLADLSSRVAEHETNVEIRVLLFDQLVFLAIC